MYDNSQLNEPVEIKPTLWLCSALERFPPTYKFYATSGSAELFRVDSLYRSLGTYWFRDRDASGPLELGQLIVDYEGDVKSTEKEFLLVAMELFKRDVDYARRLANERSKNFADEVTRLVSEKIFSGKFYDRGFVNRLQGHLFDSIRDGQCIGVEFGFLEFGGCVYFGVATIDGFIPVLGELGPTECITDGNFTRLPMSHEGYDLDTITKMRIKK